MSPQAIADPERLERFARDLGGFTARLKDDLSRLQAGFGSLGETWRDQEHQKFAREFEQTARVLRHFIQSANEHIPFLMHKAQRIHDYLDQR
jgi:uncharacterized protein YukE